MVRLALLVSMTVGFAMAASAQTHVQGYYRDNGTYVEPHYRSAPNGTAVDNYSTKGNVNPYTGQAGTRDPYGSYGSSRCRGAYC